MEVLKDEMSIGKRSMKEREIVFLGDQIGLLRNAVNV